MCNITPQNVEAARENIKNERKNTPWYPVSWTLVLPMLRTLNTDGALMSYQSFLEKGSTLHNRKKTTPTHQHRIKEQSNRPEQDLKNGTNRQEKTHVFFFPPFFPFEILLFFPTAMVAAADAADADAALVLEVSGGRERVAGGAAGARDTRSK